MIRRVAQSLYYRIMTPVWGRAFAPRIIDVQVTSSLRYAFFVGLPQAAEWYDPPKQHALAEYRWIAEHVALNGQRVIDAGAHHGHYASFLAKAGAIVTAVEPLPPNCALIQVNAALNDVRVEIIEAAVANTRGTATMIPRTNAKLVEGIGLPVKTLPLWEARPDASIVKLDIEGAEFSVVPTHVSRMPSVHTWIVEVHPAAGNPARLAAAFLERGFRADYVDRSASAVLPWQSNTLIAAPTTIIFRQS